MTEPLEPLCRYCDAPAVMCRTSGPRSSRVFRCEAHRYTEDLDAGVVIHERPTYEHLDLDAELIPAMRAGYRARKRRAAIGGGQFKCDKCGQPFTPDPALVYIPATCASCASYI